MCLKAEVSIEKFESLRVVPFKVGITCLNSLKHCFKWALLLKKLFFNAFQYLLFIKKQKKNLEQQHCFY